MQDILVPSAAPGDTAADLARSCSEYLASHTQRMTEAIEQGRRGLDVASMYSQMYDGLFCSLFCAARASVTKEEGDVGRLSVVAVGGYGRGLVAPRSDVDVIFLSDQPDDPRVLKIAERMFYPLWDAGVDVGHAVRGVAETVELARTDIRTSTTLLDMRPIAGDRVLLDELESLAREQIFEHNLEDFIQALEADTESRQQRYGDTLYLREPELKLGRGGLRDLDVVTWIARARWGVATLDELPAQGISEAELADLNDAREHLWSLRNRLHLSGRRRQDRLTFEDQEGLAEVLGYRDGLQLAVEQLMQAHYRHARIIARLIDCMGERARRSAKRPDTLVDLGNGLVVSDGHIGVDEATLEADPVTALRLYAEVVARDLPPDPAARDAIATAAVDREWCQRLRRDPESAARFMKLLARAERIKVRGGSFVREVHELGILLAMFPEMEPIICRVPHDTYHAYTADVQALKALDTLRQLRRGDLASDYRTVSRYAAEMVRPHTLSLALLLSSIGVTHPDEPDKHGAAIAGPIAERMGMSADEVAHVQWLLEHRMGLYHWAMRRDLSDPETIEEAAGEVRTAHRLNHLYLLTFCDVSAANPGAMTDWNARMLQDLTVSVGDHLDGVQGADEQIRQIRQETLSGIDDAGRRQQLATFMEEMPSRYLLANSAEGVRFHAAAAARSSEGPVVASVDSGVGAGTREILFIAPEGPGVLEMTAAALAASRFRVDSAQVYVRARADGRKEALSIFHVGHASMGEGVDLDVEVDKLRKDTCALLAGEVTTEALLSPVLSRPKWGRKGPKVRTEIHIDNSASSRYTVVDVYARDRDGLLHVIAKGLRSAGLSIAVAKVNTQGNLVADVFYVERVGGGKFEGKGQLRKLSADLRRAILKLDKQR